MLGCVIDMLLDEAILNTTDNWCPNFDGDKVEMSLYKDDATTYRICVWGADDLGREINYKTEMEAKTMFDNLKTQTDITIQGCEKLGFEIA